MALGGLYLFKIFVIIPLVSIFLTAFSCCKCEALKKVYEFKRRLKLNLFFNQGIILVMSSFQILMIASLINLRFSSNETWAEAIATMVSGVLVLITLLVVPFTLIYMSFKNI